MTTSTDTLHPVATNDQLSPISALIGSGRSGTTWLGALINSHPDVAYRFEPFHRGKHRTDLTKAKELLAAPLFERGDLKVIYDALLKADPILDRPPFFRKHYLHTPGQAALWAVARKAGPLGWIYKAAYTPRQQRPHLIFKEVTPREQMIQNLVDHAGCRVVSIIRHPCGTVSSLLKGQSKGIMPSGRLNVVGNLLRDHDPALADRFGSKIDQLDEVAKNALLWRIETEQTLQCLDGRSNGLIVIYENLCRNPQQTLEKVLNHLGLDFHEQTRRFLDESTQSNSIARARRGELPVNAYFSVFRDPVQSAEKWRSDLTPDQQNAILDMVADSTAYRFCAEMGSWDTQ